LWMMHLGDRFVIGHFMDAGAVGRYSAAYSLALMLSSIIAPINAVLYPRLMKAINSDARTLANEVRRFHRYVVLLLVPAWIGLAWIMRPLLLLIGGSELEIDLALALMLLAAVGIQQWNTVAHYALFCADQTIFSQNIWLATGALNIAANLIIVPWAGLEGAGAVTLATFALLDAGIFYRAQRWVPLGRLYRWDVTWKAFLASLVAAAASLTWAGSSVGAMLGGIVGFTLLYLLMLRVLGEITRSDYQQVRHAFTPLI